MTESKRSVVPCGPCSACCRFSITPVSVEEMAGEHYEAEVREVPGVGRVWALKRKPDGSCVYLNDESRCSIWNRAPQTCKSFDCRVEYAKRDRSLRRRMGRENATWKTVFESASSRLDSGLESGEKHRPIEVTKT